MTDERVAGQPELNWLAAAWNSGLSDRDREVLRRRQAGDTLDSIGRDVGGVTRERVRQIEKASQELIWETANTHRAQLFSIGELVTAQFVVDTSTFASRLPSAPTAAQVEVLKFMGLRHPRTWDGELTDWWCDNPDELDRRLNLVADFAPMSHEDMATAFNEVGLWMGPPVSDLLSSPNSKILHHELGWVRRLRVNRDLAYLWLERQGTPRPASEIATVTGNSERAIRETMRRDEAFSQVRPEGTWALAAWRVPGAENRYKNAEEALVDVLRDMGPMDLAALRTETLRRYPVSSWRISQCLSISAVGRLPDGRYDLAERGAKPVEDSEPTRPANIEVSGNVVGVRLTVDHDLLRGSGLPVNRWLTWYLGLRIAPSERAFQLLESPGVVTVKRASSNAQISSLRSAATMLDLVEGCKLVLLLNVGNNTARILHACGTDCPATS